MNRPAVDAQQPWLGLDSFSEDTRGFFHGREEEIGELARRVQRKPLTVLFGQSGLGKTSILRAGLVPRLRPEGYCPVYVRLDYGRDSPSPAEQIKQAIFRETQASGSWTQPGIAIEGESLWEFLHHRDDVLRDAAGRTLTPLLIFDQFEEIFTLAQADAFGRARAAEFVAELADLVENRPPKVLEARLDADDALVERFDFARCDYRILIALREDYLAHAESLKATMPSITQNRMRLARMTGEQALEAVMKPGAGLVTQEVAEAIVRYVAGGAELRNAEVEPSLLSLICRELNAARIAQGRAEISADLLAGSHATILAEFYARALADQPPGVHRFIEEELLTDSGFRENIAEERVKKAFADAGAAPDALGKLVDRRLLRIEERLDVRRVELTHDVLCAVVEASRGVRQEREARDRAEAQLAGQREREAATRRELRKARRLAAVGITLAVIAAVAAAFGIWGMRQAQATRALAEAARGESERLIVYLLDDFHRELEPVGRLQLVGELARRALDYYAGLPPELRGELTSRNQALAQVRLAFVLRDQGQIDEAGRLLGAAVPTLEQLRRGGDTSEPTAIGLALGLVGRSRLLTGTESAEAVGPAQQAVDAVAPLVQRPGASAAARRAHAQALTQLGFAEMRASRDGTAVATLQAALEAHRRTGLEDDDQAAAQFAVSAAWLVDAMAASGAADEALRRAEEGRAVVTRLLEQRPTHMVALRARALLASNTSRAQAELMQQRARLESTDAAAADLLLLLRMDPSNAISANNLGVARLNAADALRGLGRPRAAMAKVLQDIELQQPLAERSRLVLGQLTGRLFAAAEFALELGDAAVAERHLARGRSAYERWKQMWPADSYEGRFYPTRDPVFEVELALHQGELARARRASNGARERLLAVDPGGDAARVRERQVMLRRLHTAMAQVEMRAGDWAAADRHLRQVAEVRRGLPVRDLDSRRNEARERVYAALTGARLGRLAEARPLAAAALASQRGFHAMTTDDEMHKVDLALALVAAAWAEPGQARGRLAEARSAFDSMPAEARSMRTSRWVDGLIDEARRELAAGDRRAAR